MRFTKWISWGHMLAGIGGLRKFLRLLFICLRIWMEKREITVIAAVTAQSLLIAFWTLTCLFFFFSYRETKCSCTAWLTHCLIAQKPPSPPIASSSTPPLPHVFKSSSSFVPFSIPASQFASGWISVWSGDCWLNSKSIIAFAKKKYYFHQVISH